MPPALPPDHRRIVADHKHDTALHVLATTPASTKMADAAVQRIPAARTTRIGNRVATYGRRVLRVPADAAATFDPDGSWALAALVDAETEWTEIVSFGRRVGVNGQNRTRFHLPEPVAPAVLEPWAVLTPTPEFNTYDSANALIRHLLEQLNHQNLRDHAGGQIPGIM